MNTEHKEKLGKDLTNENSFDFHEILIAEDKKRSSGDRSTDSWMPLTEKRRSALAQEIYDLLLKHEMWQDVSLYFNGICWSTSDGGNLFKYNGKPFISEKDPRKYFEYVREPNIFSMSFEGPLYEELNDTFGPVYNALGDILKRYGLYYEMGNAWNLSCYED